MVQKMSLKVKRQFLLQTLGKKVPVKFAVFDRFVEINQLWSNLFLQTHFRISQLWIHDLNLNCLDLLDRFVDFIKKIPFWKDLFLYFENCILNILSESFGKWDIMSSCFKRIMFVNSGNCCFKSLLIPTSLLNF